MAKNKKNPTPVKNKKPIEQYEHKDKVRVNNPPVGLVNTGTDNNETKKTYQYDPHLDPQLQWAGKAERLSFDVDTVSLHVHERIDPRSIIEAVRKKNGNNYEQMSLFSAQDENPPLREAVEFYKHRHNWSNRLIAGDSLLVMNSLIEKEGLAGQVQMIYIDPPYGIKYGSNFQPFVNKRDVKDGKDEDLSGEPETIKAFRDTWELGLHSYLTYLRDRLLLGRELLHESGSCFVQIGDENLHHVRELLDEIFGSKNFFALITFKKTLPLGSSGLAGINDYIIWYSKDIAKIKFRELYQQKPIGEGTGYTWLEFADGTRRKMNKEERYNSKLIPEKAKIFFTSALASSGYTETCMYDFEFEGKIYKCGNKSWRTTKEGMQKLIESNRIVAPGSLPCFVQYIDDFPVQALHNLWDDTHGASDIVYVVQTSNKVIQRCMLMSTDPGDLVFDPTCGSGTTSFVAEQWGRRWITADTSRVALTLAKQRLMTSLFDYYELAHPDEGVGSGFKYETVPHITLGSIANNEPPATETLYDKPYVDNSKHRVTGPFTVEAVPSLAVRSIDDVEIGKGKEVNVGAERTSRFIGADNSIVRSGETLRQSEWRQELMRTGIRGKNKQIITFTRVEPFSGAKWLHADAETLPEAKSNPDKSGEKEKQMSFDDQPQRVVISFGPEHSPLEQRQVELAIEEAAHLVPKPKMVVFAAFQFDPEAAKDIDETKFPGVTLLKVQMNTDLLTDDLKKNRSSNESFWLIGSPDVIVKKTKEKIKAQKGYEGEKTLYHVEVLGFDYYNTKTGNIESGGKDRIAMWMLDTDYDGRSLFPRQVFFPMAGEKDGWARLAKNLKAEIDEELIERYRGTVSLPFEAGENKRIAVKIVDDRGIESLKIVEL
ncbi:MAG: site-specific DNA-methyltransferase [Ignavibacteriales bacterium]|nr:site-specific DNA-methyltransferase [Ignavibacteriales bacterium]